MSDPTEPSTKRSRQEDEMDPNSLLAVFKSFILKTPPLFNRKMALLAWMNADLDTRTRSTHFMKVYHNLKAIGRSLEPIPFVGFDIQRNESDMNRISSISDDRTDIVGKKLDAVFIKQEASLTDMSTVFMSGDLNKEIGCFFPRVDVKKIDMTTGSKENPVTTSHWRICTKDCIVGSWVPASVLMDFFALDFLKVNDFKLVYEQVNKVYKAGGTTDIQEYDTPTKIAALLALEELNQYKVLLSQTLYASHLSDATQSEQITAFCNHPSVKLASALRLKQPLTLPLGFVSNNSAYEMVTIGKLDDEDEILLCNNNITQDFYQGVTIATEVKVYKRIVGVGIVKKGKNKPSPIKNEICMKVQDFAKILIAIQRDNEKTGSKVSMVVVPAQKESDDLMEVDIFG